MLRTNAHIFPHIIHLFEQVVAKNICCAGRPLKQSCEHRNSGGLASTIMAKKRKDLPVVHLEVNAIDGLEAIRVHLSQVLNLQVLIVELKTGDFWRHWLVVALIEVLYLERIDYGITSLA